MRKLIGRLLDRICKRYYVVEYSAVDVLSLNKWFYDRACSHSPVQCTVDAVLHGGSNHGVFRSRQVAEKYLNNHALHMCMPLVPQYVTRIPAWHPIVKNSIWR